MSLLRIPSSSLYCINIQTLCYTLFIVFISLVFPLYPPTSFSLCLFPLFLSLILSALCCLLASFILTAASLITIEGWSQFSLFFLTHIYLWELVRPTTWEMNGGSNAITHSQILYFPTFSQERSRYVGKKKSLRIALVLLEDVERLKGLLNLYFCILPSNSFLHIKEVFKWRWGFS